MNFYNCLIGLFFIISLTFQQELKTFLVELDPSTSSNLWKFSGDGQWQLSYSKAYYGLNLSTAKIERLVENLPPFSKLKVSIEMNYFSWDGNDQCVISMNQQEIKLDSNTKQDKYELQLDVYTKSLNFKISCSLKSKHYFSVRNFKIEYECKSGCDDCNAKSCICLEGRYIFQQNSNQQVCKQCNDECLTCKGPLNSDCTKCKGQQKLKRLSDQGKQVCAECPSEGYFISGDYCQQCDSSCWNCGGPLKSNCTKCKPGWFPQKII